MPLNVAIIDYGTGNLDSVKRSIERAGARALIGTRPSDIEKADKIVLPGVGHFSRAVDRLWFLGLFDPLNDAVLIKKKPILGICLGMELMSKNSEEGDGDGFGWFDAETVRFPKLPQKVPQIGWNTVDIIKPGKLMAGLSPSDDLCFVHSYHLRAKNPSDVLSETTYGVTYPSAMERENIFGVQFHPEKSFKAGAVILKNFIDL